jgi:predicted nucleic acid-binding Zn ribbon protein
MKRHCLECGEDFTGRSDKKFCSAHCRTIYYNKLNSDATNFMRNINNILRKNRRLLAHYNPHGKAKVSKVKLLDAGFKFSYYTNVYRTRAGSVYYFCYEQGYLPLEDGSLALVRRQQYMDE